MRRPSGCSAPPGFSQTGRLERLPEEVRRQLPSLAYLGRRCPGARVALRTDSPTVGVSVRYEGLSVDCGMSLYQCQASYVYIGPRRTARYAGLVFPESYDAVQASGSFSKSGTMEDVMIYLPRNEVLAEVIIQVEDGARVEAPTPYAHPVPVLYYGSSITEGAFACKTSTA